MELSVCSAQRNEIDGTVRGTLDTLKLRKVSQVRHCAGGEIQLLENTGPLDASSVKRKKIFVCLGLRCKIGFLVAYGPS